jgi:hypothetical protein
LYELSENFEKEGTADEQAGDKYAVLICGMADSSSFYNNISFVHDMLLEKGYKEENITVLYDRGEDPESFDAVRAQGESKEGPARYVPASTYGFSAREQGIVDGAADRETMTKVFAELGEKVTERDELFVYVSDHGGRVGSGHRAESTIVVTDPTKDAEKSTEEGSNAYPLAVDFGSEYTKGDGDDDTQSDPDELEDRYGDLTEEELLSMFYGEGIYGFEGFGNFGSYDEITESEFAKMIKPIKAKSEILVFDQCHSGGFADRFGRGNRVAVSACRANESSYISHPMDGFPATFFGALRGRDYDGNAIDADLNGDGKVSIKEAYQYALENDEFANGDDGWFTEHPLLIARNRDPDEAFID